MKNAVPVSNEIFSLEILTVNGHFKKGIYVPSHLHLNVTYLVQVINTRADCKQSGESGSEVVENGRGAASVQRTLDDRTYLQEAFGSDEQFCFLTG